jgi:hypothetical protein
MTRSGCVAATGTVFSIRFACCLCVAVGVGIGSHTSHADEKATGCTGTMLGIGKLLLVPAPLLLRLRRTSPLV